MGLRRMSARDADASGRVASALELVEFDDTVVTFGYVIMRLAMVGQWVRLAASDPASRGTAVRFAVGITGVQVLWVARLGLPEAWQLWTFFPVHVAAARRESAACSNALIDALAAGEHLVDLLWLAVSGLVITAAIWWIYCIREQHEALSNARRGFAFGYPHCAIFAAVGRCRPGWRSRSTRSPGRRKCRMLSPDSP
ncbi:hypothetical protein DEA06_15315 [Microbacterium sp. Gd 4-13]|nr:hypothetical protein DEA06_15315 [Microbacterium sp. Gd 4-13]